MEGIPKELLLLIIQELDYKSLLMFRMVNHLCNTASKDQNIMRLWAMKSTELQNNILEGIEGKFYYNSTAEVEGLRDQREMEADLTSWQECLETIRRKCRHCRKMFTLAHNVVG